jgi:membrane protein
MKHKASLRSIAEWGGSILRIPGRLTETVPPIARGMVKSWREDRIPGLAAEIAFFTVLAMVPGLLAVIAALGSLEFVLGNELAREAEERIVSFLAAVLTERADQTLRAVEEIFSRDNSGLVSFATVAALWAMSRSLMGTIRALDVAFDLPRQDSWLKTRIKALLLALGTVVILALLLAVVIVGPLLGLGRALAEFVGTPAQATELFLLIRYPLAFLLLMVWAQMIYQFGPNHDWPWRWNAPGAALAALLWLLFSVAFALYLDIAGTANPVFGLLGGVLILLVWLYLLSLSLLAGAELNAEIADLKGRPRATTTSQGPRAPGWWSREFGRFRKIFVDPAPTANTEQPASKQTTQ